MKTHKFKATFWHRGKYINTVLEAGDYTQVRAMLTALYPGATSVTITQID